MSSSQSHTEETMLRGKQNCCRLCLAPDNECISILNSYAADKEPLVKKIHNCVSIRITPNDRLSLRICHACVSYLNSWQSFKNRCISSQVKQRNWLEFDKRPQLLDNNVSITVKSSSSLLAMNEGNNNNNNNNHNASASTSSGSHHHSHEHEQLHQQEQDQTDYLEGITTLKKRKSLTVYVSQTKDQDQAYRQHLQQQQQQQQQRQHPPQPLERQQAEQLAQQQQQSVQLRQLLQLQQSQQQPKHSKLQLQPLQPLAMRQDQRPFSQSVKSPFPNITATATATATATSASCVGHQQQQQLQAQQPSLHSHEASLKKSHHHQSTSVFKSQTQPQRCLMRPVVPETVTMPPTGSMPLPISMPVAMPMHQLPSIQILTQKQSSPSPFPSIAAAVTASASASASAAATATITLSSSSSSTSPRTPPSLLSATQQLRLFRRFSYNPVPACDIKEEPLDPDDSDYAMKTHDESDDMVDPTMFLERTEEEGEEPIMGPEYTGDRSGLDVTAAPAMDSSTGTKEASCRACNLKFSTRANARRHERNLHPNLFQLTTSTPNSTPVTKPTPSFVAALELQRSVAAVAASQAAGSGVTEQKFRQEVVNAFNSYESGYDYEHAEKYQHLLTDEKIVFIKQNEEFLQQYQTMTCRCCNRFYTTYKNFMAHMRKKYTTLPRNLCFNCLKLNDSKALFISHLKRRNCINLYKVLHSLMETNDNFASAVAATAAAVPEKLRAKELLVNKMYECKLCPRSFRLKMEFRSHVYEQHGDEQKKDVAPSQCSFCGLEIEDPSERKRHHKNLDCIVMLRCVTCEGKFDNHQKFLDHVYEQHLSGFDPAAFTGNGDHSPSKKTSGAGAGSSADESRSSHTPSASHHIAPPPQKSQYFSRMPQACPICGQQYNNYNNVLRHMESKHPDQLPQTYKCVKCSVGYPRLSNLREHMVSMHGTDKARHTGFEYIVNADAVKIADSATYSGRYDYVMKDLMSIANGGTNADDDGNSCESAPKKIRLDTSNSNSSAANNNNSVSGGPSGNSSFSSVKACKICKAVFSNNIGLSNHMRSHNSAAAQSHATAAALAKANSTNALTITAVPSSKVPPALAGVGLQAAVSAVVSDMFKARSDQAGGGDKRFRRMRCRHCQRRFSSKKALRFHMMHDHQIPNVQFIKCTLCDAEFACEKGLNVHLFKVHQTQLKGEPGAAAASAAALKQHYECNVCSIVYRSQEQLMQHKKTAHGQNGGEASAADVGDDTAGGNLSGLSTPVSSVGGGGDSSAAVGAAPLYWYQCKYCPSNFNTNKKLAIHINSHDEFDSNDYSCKDCGNVYSGRKSLWVHRYKKHPQVAEPSECVLCRKVFFDRQMLEHHKPSCNRKPITATGAMAEPPVYRHKTGDDEDDEDMTASASAAAVAAAAAAADTLAAASLKIKLPEVACTICGQIFTDQERFTKHIQMHEMELYTDNPLAAMFDTGPADPNQFYLDRVNDNGEYACDLCHKTFTQMTALKVHRKWHFRGDSKQQNNNNSQIESNNDSMQTPTQATSNQAHLQGLQAASAAGLMPSMMNHHSHHSLSTSMKSQKRKRELKCEYCPSTFISNNNLRRHIFELHKDEVSDLPEPPKIQLDEYMTCRRCNGKKFETKQGWIDHKVAEARVMKPFGPFQWGCDLCGTYVSRKEKLIHHIFNHMFNLVKKGDKVILTVDPPKNKKQAQLQQQLDDEVKPPAAVIKELKTSEPMKEKNNDERAAKNEVMQQGPVKVKEEVKADESQEESQEESRDSHMSQESQESQDSDESRESRVSHVSQLSVKKEIGTEEGAKNGQMPVTAEEDVDDDDNDDDEEEDDDDLVGDFEVDEAVEGEEVDDDEYDVGEEEDDLEEENTSDGEADGEIDGEMAADADMDADADGDGDGDVDDDIEGVEVDVDFDGVEEEEEDDEEMGEYDPDEMAQTIVNVNEDANDAQNLHDLTDDDDDLEPMEGFDNGDLIEEDDGTLDQDDGELVAQDDDTNDSGTDNEKRRHMQQQQRQQREQHSADNTTDDHDEDSRAYALDYDEIEEEVMDELKAVAEAQAKRYDCVLCADSFDTQQKLHEHARLHIT